MTNYDASEITFKVRGKWSERAVACRLAMCLGIGNPLAWHDGDEGSPFWHEDDQKWQVDNSNNYWLRKIDETEPDEISRQQALSFPVRTFKLNYRYATPDRVEALKGLCKWLECDLVFGA
jgi:hypothetical protein